MTRRGFLAAIAAAAVAKPAVAKLAVWKPRALGPTTTPIQRHYTKALHAEFHAGLAQHLADCANQTTEMFVAQGWRKPRGTTR